MSLGALLVVFVAAAAVTWVAGIYLTRASDVLDARFGLGEAVGGMLLLGLAGSLPELAITASAALSGELDLATGNLLGGIAMQTLVIVLLDATSRRPLDHGSGLIAVLVEAQYARRMRGAVAAGHPLTAEAGARVLAEGGNAVDACIAAAFVGAVAEGPLTGPAGGGFLLVAVPGGEPVVLDCFFACPSEPLGPMEEALVDFADSGTQTFHVGDGSVAVPGLVAGLEEAHRRFGSRAWPDLVQPAVELALRGVEVDAPRAFLHGILAGILLRTEEGRRVFGDTGRVSTRELAVTLEEIRDHGPAGVAALVPELAEDLASYDVIERTPLERAVGGHRVLTTPAPSLGGEIVLEILDGLAALDPWSLPGEAAVVGEAYARGLAGRPTGTTHVSVVDADGRAAALSSTLGSGSGVFRGGAQLNNMLGELDVIGPGERDPGDRLPSMMAPTIVLDGDEPRLVLGSAGSVRLAGAIAQVTQRVLAGTPVDGAIGAPRLHVEGRTLHLEGGWPDEAIDELPASWDVVRWESLNLYFGGVQAVERRPDGALLAAGDPRRGGAGLVVS